jgi:menaquinone-dependent protoporphyrinogen oxidase
VTPRVLVGVATRHGATVGVAESVAEGIRGALPGAEVDVRRAADVADLDGYDAVVLGSGVYFGHWLEEARELLLRCAIGLWDLPVWIFSSGPVGDPPRPPEALLDVDEVQRLTRALGHRLFPGRLDVERLDFGERAVVTAFAAPLGDFRDPAAARSWGAEIAAELAARAADEPVAR